METFRHENIRESKQSNSAFYNNIKYSLQSDTNPVSSGREQYLHIKTKCCSFPHTIKDRHLPMWTPSGTFLIFSPWGGAFIRSISISERVAVKLHRAEDNGHIARSSSREGMSVARGHCQERRAVCKICHGSCLRAALRSISYFPN